MRKLRIIILGVLFCCVASAQSINDKKSPDGLSSPPETDKTLLKKPLKPAPTPDRDRSKPLKNSDGKQNSIPTDVD